MKMGRLINKGKAAVITIWVMSLITTNAQPKMWQVAMIGILLYEAILLTLNTWQRETRKRRKLQNINAGVEDMRRVEEERLYWFMREAG